MPTITSPQHYTGGSTKCNEARKIKSTKIGKEEIKLSLFTNDMNVCLGNPKIIYSQTTRGNK